MQHYSIHVCSWNTHQQQLAAIRREVFIQEQQVPEELEWDEFDEVAQHIIAFNHAGQPIATGRIKADGHIGRMAVLKVYRQQSIGSAILLALLDIAKQQKLDKVYLHAQVSAISFYEQHGFVCNSGLFMDAGIPHKSMIKRLNNE